MLRGRNHASTIASKFAHSGTSHIVALYGGDSFMGIWTNFVDLIHAILLGLAMLFGGNMALAIGVLSLTFRLALLPLTLRMAYRSLQLQAALKRVEPELASIRKKYKDNPQRIDRKSTRLNSS